MRALRVLLASVLLVPVGFVATPSAGAATTGTTCTTFSGHARVTPGLPMVGSTQRVTPTVSVKGAKLSGCHGAVTGGTAAATLKFAKPSNCTLLVKQITANIASKASGTLSITWNNRKTSKIAVALSFGGVPDKPTIASFSGRVTAGLFKGLKGSGTVLWTLGDNECFGGSPLTSLTFSAFAPFVTK